MSFSAEQAGGEAAFEEGKLLFEQTCGISPQEVTSPEPQSTHAGHSHAAPRHFRHPESSFPSLTKVFAVKNDYFVIT